MTIESVSARLLTAKLQRPWGPGVTENHVVVVTLRASDGAVGTGFCWVPTIGPTAVLALLENDLARFVPGLPEQPDVVWDAAWAHLHEAGHGLATIALAGVDLALWDLAARRVGTSVDRLVGRRRDVVPTYGSGVNLHYTLDELVKQAQRWVAAGHTAVKIKVGRPGLSEDVERVAAVREVIGPDARLMVDANQRWDLPSARRAIMAMQPYGLHWVEEPLRANDLDAHRRLRSSVDVPIALGENLHTIYRFREFIAADAVDVVQPNVVRVGGITPFLRIVELARSCGIGVAPHLLPELSGQLAATMAEPTMVEDIEEASFAALGLLRDEGPVELGAGFLVPRGRPGLGYTFVD